MCGVTTERPDVLAHPIRYRVLTEYQDGPVSPSDVARRTGLPINVVSYHTQVLVRHACLVFVGAERRRGALTRSYRATVPQDIEDERWIEMSVQQRRRLVLETLRLVAAEAGRAADATGFEHIHAGLIRYPAELDDQGRREAAQLLRRTVERLAALDAEARSRVGPRRLYRVAIFGFVRG